jgi:RNA polymerase sigma factor (sigma-70 family)
MNASTSARPRHAPPSPSRLAGMAVTPLRNSGDLPDLAARAQAGDAVAWRCLVDHLKGVVWKVVLGFDIPDAERQDAFASTFFRLYERLSTVREPEKLPGWIATTARNEVYALLRSRKRLVPLDEIPMAQAQPDTSSDNLLETEIRKALYRAYCELPAEGQAMLRALCADPPLTYEQIGQLLNMPHGSIGPTRQRYVERLRRSPHLTPFLNGGAS